MPSSSIIMLKIRKSRLIAKVIKLHPSKDSLRSKHTINLREINDTPNKAIKQRTAPET